MWRLRATSILNRYRKHSGIILYPSYPDFIYLNPVWSQKTNNFPGTLNPFFSFGNIEVLKFTVSSINEYAYYPQPVLWKVRPELLLQVFSRKSGEASFRKVAQTIK